MVVQGGIKMEDVTVIKIEKATRERMKKHGIKGDSYNDIINKLIDMAEGVKKELQ